MKPTLYTMIAKHNLSLREMGETLGISRQKVGALVNKLEKRGYITVKRARSPYVGGNYLQHIYKGKLFNNNH